MGIAMEEEKTQSIQVLPLRGARVLVVEDEYYIADDLRRALEAAGAEVVGPFSTIEKANCGSSRPESKVRHCATVRSGIQLGWPLVQTTVACGNVVSSRELVVRRFGTAAPIWMCSYR